MKNFKKTALALVVTLVAGYGVYTSQQKSELSELVLANIEALADNESPVKIPCVDDKSSECKFLTKTTKHRYGNAFISCAGTTDG